MRRICAAVLLVLLVTQSSGAALAAMPLAATPGTPPVQTLGSIVAPILATIENSQLVAELSGNGDRYALMHAPAPHFERRGASVDALALLRASRPLHPVERAGIRHEVTMPSRDELDPRHHRLDPLAMRHSSVAEQQPTAELEGALHPLAGAPLGNLAPSNRRTLHPLTAGRRSLHAIFASSGGTGIERWWTYEERAIPGIGKAMVNVGTGNLVVSATDVDIPERGIDLAFARTYNLQSLHDYNGDDGGDSAIFGNRWTNNFDANMVYDSTANTISIYDMDGSDCVFTANAGTWVPCTGHQGETLAPTDSSDCTYAWTKKSGTVYWFHADNNGNGTCGIPNAKKGHIQEILGRNLGNSITFEYSYDGSGQGSENVTEIDAVHSDGQELVMKFGKIPTTTINELSTITRPDGAVLQYSYDTSGNLLEVDRPGNDAVQWVPPGHNVPANDVPETYAYVSGTSTLQEACGPRCTITGWKPNDTPVGSALTFVVDASLRLTSWQVDGVLNFIPDDGKSAPLQAGSTDFRPWYTGNFVYGSGTGCAGTGAGTTTFCDTDGHSAIWTIAANSGSTQTQDWTGSLWLVTQQQWDASNDLTSSIDARGNQTNYAYDANGNTIATALPPVGDTSAGSNFRATSLYSYDPVTNNLLSYCDPTYTHAMGKDWSGNPGNSDTLCPQSVGSHNSPAAAIYAYDTSDANEPFGKLIATYSPMGYEHQISYAADKQGGDFGLPTFVGGTQITQFDNTLRAPQQAFSYDALGNLISYGPGNGAWSILYDANNRAVAHIDPDGYASVSCSYLDGSAFYTETPAQHGYDGGAPITSGSNGKTICPNQLAGGATAPQYAASYGHDLDGDENLEIHHFMQGPDVPSGFGAPYPGKTRKWYDGLDRLVEVQQPQDANADTFSFAWMTRYIYDLNAGSNGPDQVSIDGASVYAYGNLYKTQECIPSQTTVTMGNNQNNASCAFKELRGNSFDALDRSLNKYEVAFGTTPQVAQVYDQSGSLGLLGQSTNAMGQYTQLAYDPAGRVNQKTYDNPAVTPNETYTFDPNGRTAGIKSSLYGLESYTFDGDGRLIEKDDPTGGNYNNPGKITYGYYPDGKRASLSLVITPTPTFNGVPFNGANVFQYAYRADGKLANQRVNAGTGGNYEWAYTPAGRETSQSDPSTGAQIHVYPPQCGQNNKPPCQQYSITTLSAKKYTYDAYGRVATLQFPASAQMSGFAYDAEGKVINDWGKSSNFFIPPVPQYLYSTRGELVWTPQPPPTGNGPFATPVVAPVTFNGAVCVYHPCSVDARTGQSLSQGSNNPSNAPTYPAYTYDGAGRNTATALQCVYGNKIQDTGTLTKAYDAENHTISNTPAFQDLGAIMMGGNQGACVASPAQNTTAWGNSGHPYNSSFPGVPNLQSPQTADEVHWDGDQVLYDVSSMNSPTWTAITLYVGTLGQVTIGGTQASNISKDVMTNDRDYTGQVVQLHNTQVYTGFSPPGVRLDLTIYKNGSTIQFSPPSWGGDTALSQYATPISNATRKDGYQIGGLTVQGVRTYDPTASQWSTPDAYAGDVHDPNSQKPFMWNGNDPLEWADPSGYIIDYANDATKSALQKEIEDLISSSPTFKDMWNKLSSDSRVFTITLESSDTAAANGEGGDFQPNDIENLKGELINVAGGTINISAGMSAGDTFNALAHEITHAFDSLNAATFGADRGAQVFTDTNNPYANKEEVNGYVGAHTILGQAARAQDWVGPATWMSDGMSPSWGTFCAQFQMYGASC